MLPIEGTRLILRRLDPADLKDFLAYRQNPEVCRYQGFDVFSEAKAQSFIDEQKKAPFGKAGHWIQIGIAFKDSNLLIGDCALKFQAYEPRTAELGYTINPQYQQKGYATEAIKTLLQHIFKHHSIHRVLALVDTRNISSIKLVEKLGFRKEAHFLQSYFDEQDMAWMDEYQYALLHSEF